MYVLHYYIIKIKDKLFYFLRRTVVRILTSCFKPVMFMNKIKIQLAKKKYNLIGRSSLY